jgi:hypothetical protein
MDELLVFLEKLHREYPHVSFLGYYYTWLENFIYTNGYAASKLKKQNFVIPFR